MKKILLATACVLASFGAVHQAHAQKEAAGGFYEMKIAVTACKWTGIPDTKKLDTAIAEIEKALAITPAEKASLMKAAEADLKSDPANCAPDGILRQMYDSAVK